MWIMTIVFIIIDLISKYIIDKYLTLNESIKIIKGFLNITYVRNTGVAFSMFNDSKYFILIISTLIIIGIIYYVYKNKSQNKLETIGYSLVLGGAIGNLIDRIFKGYVIDFIDVKIFSYDYPIFNLADTFIVVGVLLLIVCAWRCKNGNKG